jgi:hypothetical protein
MLLTQYMFSSGRQGIATRTWFIKRNQCYMLCFRSSSHIDPSSCGLEESNQLFTRFCRASYLLQICVTAIVL